jgi:hypothetical protein
MKQTLIILCLFFQTKPLIGQDNLSTSASLSKYCPTSKVQYRATCYAYAVVYTALSTEYNIANNITNKEIINKDFFSPGYIASYHNSTLSLIHRSPFCGKYGFAYTSLDDLKTIGTVMASDYDCDCKSFKSIQNELPSKVKTQKITDYATLAVNNTFSQASVDWIKSAIFHKHPVIIGLFQNSTVYDNKSLSIDSLTLDGNTKELIEISPSGLSNHVICILGYNDKYKNEIGYFLVKNNFEGWGDGNGFAWIPYTYLMPLIEEAYYINGLKK